MHFVEQMLHFNAITTDHLTLAEFRDKEIEMDVLRLDKIHPVISGNKWFKLKNYLTDAIENKYQTILSFGGAYSNHIVATACTARLAGLHAVGIIRGDRPPDLSHTLQTAEQYGMRLVFISRTDYRRKDTDDFLGQLRDQFPESYFIPEGGSGILGRKGSGEILECTNKNRYDHIFCAVGTGTMFIGLANASAVQQYISGISVLKGISGDWEKSIEPFIHAGKRNYCRIHDDYHFGGYAKKTTGLIRFMNWLYDQSGIPTDFVYTAKLFYAVLDLAGKNYFSKGTKILLIHSGGLQGNLSLAPGTLKF